MRAPDSTLLQLPLHRRLWILGLLRSLELMELEAH
jgi:hypothetical protein